MQLLGVSVNTQSRGLCVAHTAAFWLHSVPVCMGWMCKGILMVSGY